MPEYEGLAPFRVEATRPSAKNGMLDAVVFEEKFADFAMALKAAKANKADGVSVTIVDSDDVVMTEL